MIIEKINKELIKKENKIFNEYYEGINGNKKVICILDKYAIKYIKFIDNKKIGQNEYGNLEKEKCIINATKWLNS